MIPYEINGLPLHALLVHAVVILLPLTALAVVLHAAWPAARRRLGVVTPLAGLVVLILVPITVQAGLWLQQRVVATVDVQRHVNLGQTLLPWAIALFAVGLLEWGWYRFAVGAIGGVQVSAGIRRAVAVVLLVAAVAVAAGAVIDVVLIGEAGTRAVWQRVITP